MIDLIWDCTVIIHNEELDDLPIGADAPPRQAVIEAIENLGLSIHSVSSGWGADESTPKIAKLKRRIASLENECVEKHSALEERDATISALRAQVESIKLIALNPTVIDFVRCGIGANYGDKYYENMIEKIHTPLVDLARQLKESELLESEK